MLTNGISVLGWCLVAVGWAILLFAPGDMRTSLVNIHRLALADAAIISGFFLVLAGAVSEGFSRLLQARSPDVGRRPTPSESDIQPHAEAEEGLDEKIVGHSIEGQPPNFNMLKKTHRIRLGAFDTREIHEMRSGEFIAQGAGGWRNFETLSDAESYVKAQS